MKLPSIKIQLAVFLSILALVLAIVQKNYVFLLGIFIAIVPAVLLDSVINLIKTKKFIITESSIVTGLILGYVLSDNQPWYFILYAALFGILSKHIIRAHGRHILNPAGFGVFLTALIFGAVTQWKASYMWYVLIPAGVYFSFKIRKLELLAGYFLTSFVLFAIVAVLRKVSFIDSFLYFNLFFVFIMMIEPKTTPVTKWGKIIFGGIIAVVIFILNEYSIREAELLSLMFLNLAVLFLDKINLKRK
jgi:Na+-translocating ferredoxin:NAD+ oxidoreductase RnfD subunit